ncbi:MAG: pantoate--beta-alanine ligase [Deltaproteobacteria bacterium]|nr:MAG: pantoate--beta-alanine ligase [Deltaproteobacteria bacterium]
MEIIKNVKEMQKKASQAKKQGKKICFVPTMGFFHEGHITLMREGRKLADILAISIFVNPTQFSQGEDLDVYPRDLKGDIEKIKDIGVDWVFAPSASEMYPEGFQSYVIVEKVTRNLCGKFRPGHFRGVATICLKLFNIIKPDLAVFGEKDFQQLVTIKQMVKDLNLDLKVIGVPTVREKDGLAMSSRNIYLTPNERKKALAIFRSLKEANEMFKKGERKAIPIIKHVREILEKENGISIDYVQICDINTIEDIDKIDKKALLAVAVRIGSARLIDNIILGRD